MELTDESGCELARKNRAQGEYLNVCYVTALRYTDPCAYPGRAGGWRRHQQGSVINLANATFRVVQGMLSR